MSDTEHQQDLTQPSPENSIATDLINPPKPTEVDGMAEHPTEEAVSSDLQELCDAYITSYNNNDTPNAIRMDRAKTFALALLQHYYPPTSGYIVRPSTLGPMVKSGINFMLKNDDGSDPTYTPLPKLKVKKGKRKLTKREEYAREVGHWYPFTVYTKWHAIAAEDIAGFDVLKKATPGDFSGDAFEKSYAGGPGAEKDVYRLHTVLAIVIDDLQLLPQFAATNDVNRGDILTDALCSSCKIQSGYGILLFGTRLEVYDFENGAATEVRAENRGNWLVTEEPRVTLWVGVGLSAEKWGVVDEIMERVVVKEVRDLEMEKRQEEEGEDVDADGEDDDEYLAQQKVADGVETGDGQQPADGNVGNDGAGDQQNVDDVNTVDEQFFDASTGLEGGS